MKYCIIILNSNIILLFQVQGQTVRDPTAVVVDLKHCRDPGQVYVTISRAQKLSQLFILNNLYWGESLRQNMIDVVMWNLHRLEILIPSMSS